MKYWEIKILYYGKISVPKGAMTPGLDPDLIMNNPYLGFLLQNGKRDILVDSGISDKFIVDGKAWGGYSAEGGRAYVERALAKAGVDAADIEAVLYTHLHNDHAANATLFKNARLVFQKDEWITLLDPLPVMRIRRDYDPDLINELKKMDCVKIQGDMEWTQGIRIYKTPGHSPGSMSIGVDTERGTKFIVGDHWHFFCMAFGKQEEIMDMLGNKHKITPAPDVYEGFIPSSLVYNYYDYYDSCYKLKALMKEFKPEFLLPGHEPSLIFTGV